MLNASCRSTRWIRLSCTTSGAVRQIAARASRSSAAVGSSATEQHHSPLWTSPCSKVQPVLHPGLDHALEPGRVHRRLPREPEHRFLRQQRAALRRRPLAVAHSGCGRTTTPSTSARTAVRRRGRCHSSHLLTAEQLADHHDLPGLVRGGTEGARPARGVPPRRPAVADEVPARTPGAARPRGARGQERGRNHRDGGGAAVGVQQRPPLRRAPPRALRHLTRSGPSGQDQAFARSPATSSSAAQQSSSVASKVDVALVYERVSSRISIV